MLCANAGRPARQDFAALRKIPLDLRGVFIVDILTFIDAELAHLPTLAAM